MTTIALTPNGTRAPLRRWFGHAVRAYRGWEYWNSYLFESPAYVRLAWRLWRAGLGPRGLLKANWALDHGGFAFASKFAIQRLFPEGSFPQTLLLSHYLELGRKCAEVVEWQQKYGISFPVILKPDNGRIGMGVVRARNVRELEQALSLVDSDYLVQEFCDLPLEAGIFFYRLKGECHLLSLTAKEFPSVVGDGSTSVAALIRKDSRLVRFTRLLSRQVDLDHVPAAGERYYLSYVGNHAQGAVFHSFALQDTNSFLSAVTTALGAHPGFNFGRLDVRAANTEALLDGDFTIIEVNGVDSLSISVFDPQRSIFDAYGELFRQYDTLLAVALEQRGVAMSQLSLPRILLKTIRSELKLRNNHERLIAHALR